MMKNLKHVLLGTLAVLAVLLLTGCWEKDNPVRTSLNVDTSTLTLAVGESATRTATTKAQWDYQITYTSSNPAVATVDQNGKVTAVSEGEVVITVSMDETIKSWYAAATRSYNVVVKEKEPGPAPVVAVTGITLDKPTMEMGVGGTGQLTATLAPDDATDKTVTWSSDKPAIASVDATGKVTAVAVGTATITAKAGDKTATCTVTVKEGTDLSMVNNAGGARSTMSTANCYMVHTAGYYKLPLVYGNAIKDGADNTDAYKPGGTTSTTYCANFVNHAGTAINAPWITKATTGTGADKGMGITVSSAELLWQDAQGLVTAVGIDGDYLTLTVGKNASEQEGNAVIAAKDAGGNIVWSWHIWVTKETFASADLTTVNTSSHTYSVTPVNLGWVATGGDGKQGYNTYYQWGRKDAFIPSTGSGNTNRTVYDINGTAVATPLTYTAGTTATIADNIKNPTTFYYNSSTAGPCDTEYYNMWDAQQTGTGNIKKATKKTVYDPCPAGFCVPTGNLYYFMGNGNTRSDLNWDGTNKGKTWLPDLYFPASGFRYSSSGTLGNVGSGGYDWSASPYSSSNGHFLYFNSSYWCWNNDSWARGFPVRAVAEE